MITTRRKHRQKHELGADKPTVWIGKNGITGDVLAEISKQLEKTGMVKVKILKAALGKTPAKLMAYNIASQTGATLIDTRGHTFILYKGKTEK